MSFPPYYTKIIQVVIIAALTWDIGYLWVDDSYITEFYFTRVLKLIVCITALISFLNDKGRMLVICKDGLLFEECDVSEVKPKFSFFYIIIAIVYNPIYSFFNTETIWMVTDVITLLYFMFRSVKNKK